MGERGELRRANGEEEKRREVMRQIGDKSNKGEGVDVLIEEEEGKTSKHQNIKKNVVVELRLSTAFDAIIGGDRGFSL